MNFRPRKNRSSSIATIDMAPLVDVVFLLLVFFLLTNTLSAKESVDVSLPGSSTGTTRSEEILEVTVAADGGITFKGQEVTLETFSETLARSLAQVEKASLLVNADAEASVQTMLSVMDTAKNSGVQSIEIATKRK